MSFEIDLSSHVSESAVDHDLLINAIEEGLRLEGVSSAVLSLTLVDNPTMHRMNREYLQHDYPTDVISFPLEWLCDGAEFEDRVGRKEGRSEQASIEGEIVISQDYACEMAKRCGWSVQNELTLYAVHGMLHICGYDDLSPEEKQVMRSREKAILGHLGIEVTYPDDAVFEDDDPPGSCLPAEESSRGIRQAESGQSSPGSSGEPSC